MRIGPAIIAVLALGASAGAFAQQSAQHAAPFSPVARRTFADLLKIPLEDPPVTVTVRGTREEDGLVIEDIAWESLDGERPVGYVIRPAKASGRLPAVVYQHGSSGSRDSECFREFRMGEWTNANGKTSTRLLGAARELARRGYLALAFTMRGLDARAPNTEDQSKELLIRGRNLMGAEVYEHRQALTYLQQRPDVDPQRIGMGGLSYGGITTFNTWLVDLRIAAAAPICGGVGSWDTYVRMRQNRGYHGLSLWIPGQLSFGDQADYAAAMAPRPLMLWAPHEDIAMPREAVDRFVSIVRPAYIRAGAPEALVIHQRPGIHELSLEAFEAMSRFFDAHLRKAR
jgi:dienelactone hydrolase